MVSIPWYYVDMPSAHARPPKVRCIAHLKGDKTKRCKRYAVPYMTTCSWHGAATRAAQDEATRRSTLATMASVAASESGMDLDAATLESLLSGEPTPLDEALIKRVHTLNAVAEWQEQKVRRELRERGTVDLAALSDMLDHTRAATGATIAVTRTAMWQAIVNAHANRVNIQAVNIAAVVEAALTGLWPWLTSLGLSKPDLDAVKRSVGLALRAAMESVPTAPRDRDGKPQLPPASPPDVGGHLVLVPRAELAALRERARRHTPQLSDRPADVFVPCHTRHYTEGSQP